MSIKLEEFTISWVPKSEEPPKIAHTQWLVSCRVADPMGPDRVLYVNRQTVNDQEMPHREGILGECVHDLVMKVVEHYGERVGLNE